MRGGSETGHEKTRNVDLRSPTLLAPLRGGAEEQAQQEQYCSMLAHDVRGKGHGTSGSAVSHLGVGGVCVGLSVGLSA